MASRVMVSLADTQNEREIGLMRDSSTSAFGPFLRKPSPAVPFCQSYVALPLLAVVRLVFIVLRGGVFLPPPISYPLGSTPMGAADIARTM